MSEQNSNRGDACTSAGMDDPPKWQLGERHPDYGVVQMMGVTGGEPYRWFVSDDGCVSMIPLSMLDAKG